jgi:hypothetical protein
VNGRPGNMAVRDAGSGATCIRPRIRPRPNREVKRRPDLVGVRAFQRICGSHAMPSPPATTPSSASSARPASATDHGGALPTCRRPTTHGRSPGDTRRLKRAPGSPTVRPWPPASPAPPQRQAGGPRRCRRSGPGRRQAGSGRQERRAAGPQASVIPQTGQGVDPVRNAPRPHHPPEARRRPIPRNETRSGPCPRLPVNHAPRLLLCQNTPAGGFRPLSRARRRR